MVDYSFLRFKSSFDEAKNIGDSPTATHIKHTIQLSPNEAYLQITNVDGGFAFGGNYNAYIVDCNDEVLKDITDHIFIDEFSYNSETQSKVEIINLNVDYYMKTVFIKIESTISNVVLWSNPITISDYRLWETSYFQYKNYDNFENIGYTNAQCWQSIRLKCYFDIPVDESEIESYYQISRSRTISPRALIKRFSQYKIDFINSFTFIRLNTLLKHELIYINGVRITDKPVVEGQEREGDSNWFPSTFVCAKNENDTLEYEYQVFDGFQLIDKVPEGVYTLCSLPTQIQGQFNSEITIGTGTLTIYDASDNSVVQSFTQDDIIEVNDFTFGINGLDTYVTTNGSYYILFDSGLIESELYGIVYGGISEPTEWTFTIQNGDYSSDDYSSDDYLTDCPSPLIDNLVLFYKFNETSGTTATDDSGNSNNGTITNVSINETGVVDKGYYFNSGGVTDEYVTIPDDDTLSLGSGAFSIEVWVLPDNTFGYILNKYNQTAGDLEYRLWAQSGVLQFYIYTDASNNIGIADNVTYSDGVWNQIIITYDGSGDASGLKMKVNNTVSSFSGVETGTYTGMPNTTQQVVLGQQSDALTGSNRYQGKMDILRIWKGYELSDAEITTLYNSGNGTETL